MEIYSLLTITYSKSTIEKLDEGMKYVKVDKKHIDLNRCCLTSSCQVTSF